MVDLQVQGELLLKALKLRSVVALALLLAPATSVSSEARFAVVDLHVDLPYQLVFHGRPLSDGTGQAHRSALVAGEVAGLVLPLFVPHAVSPSGPRAEDLERAYVSVFDALAAEPTLALPGCIAPPGQIRTWLAFEGAGPLARAPHELTAWVARGVRLVGLVHTHNNELASSSADSPDRGLTAAGAELVRRAHALGVAVDISHASTRTVRDVLALAAQTRGVVVATHSNARALTPHPRNLSDEEVRGIASTGGVVGVNFHTPFVSAARGGSADITDVVRHVKYLLRVAGEDHVAIGSDFEGGIRPATGLADAARFPALAGALLRSGVSERAVRKLLSENALRVLCGSGK